MLLLAGGKVVTLFSAPSYPMHQADGELPYHNSGSIVKLTAPDYATPAAHSFVAVVPRPPVSWLCARGGLEHACCWDAVEMRQAIAWCCL